MKASSFNGQTVGQTCIIKEANVYTRVSLALLTTCALWTVLILSGEFPRQSGQGLAEGFKKSFEKMGGKVLAMVPHDEKAAESYNAELKKALAGNPDRLAAFSYP